MYSDAISFASWARQLYADAAPASAQRHLASVLTDYADQAVLLPIAAVLTAGLLLSGWRRGALAWALAIAGVLGCTLALKLIFLACGQFLLGPELQSPSGHTAAAAVIYGGLLGLLVRRARTGPVWRVLLPIAVAALIGVSRLALGMHTLPEVLTGGAVGVSGAAIAGSAAGLPPLELRLRPLLVTVGALALLLHGIHLPAEGAIRDHLVYRFWPLSACRAPQSPREASLSQAFQLDGPDQVRPFATGGG